MSKVSSNLYSVRKLTRDLEVIASLDSKKILRRVKNKLVGRFFARIGFWKFLWG